MCPAEDYALVNPTGSYMYMAPEVFHSRPYDEKADVFSFGCMLSEMFCGYMLSSVVTGGTGNMEDIVCHACRVGKIISFFADAPFPANEISQVIISRTSQALQMVKAGRHAINLRLLFARVFGSCKTFQCQILRSEKMCSVF